MNKKIVIIIIVAILVIVGIICFFAIKKNNSENIEENVNLKRISYEVIDNFNSSKFDYTKKGYYVENSDPGAPYYYIITSGTKSTGGYSIDVVSVTIDKSNNVKIVVKESAPQKGSTVTMAFTYPSTCIRLSSVPSALEIINTKGEAFKKLN